jgi:hypothetical protein
LTKTPFLRNFANATSITKHYLSTWLIIRSRGRSP